LDISAVPIAKVKGEKVEVGIFTGLLPPILIHG
jgi:hypothetical protein